MERTKRNFIFSVLIAALSPLIYGISLTIIDVVIPSLPSKPKDGLFFSIQHLRSLIFLGSFISTIVVSKINLEKSRIMLTSSFCFSLGFALLLYSNIWILAVARILQGMGAGLLCTNVPIYLGYISPIQYRGNLSSLFSVGLLSGIIISQAIQLTKLSSNSIIIFLSIFSLIHAISTLSIIKLKLSTDFNNASFFSLISNKKAFKSILLMAALHSSHHMSGINHILFNSQSIFTNSHPGKNLIFLLCFGLAVTILLSSTVEKIGRKYMLSFSFTLLIISCAFFYFKKFSQFFAYVHIFGFNIGLGPVPFMLIGELFPPEYITQGGLFSVSVNNLAALGSMLVPSKELDSSASSFLIYGGVMSIAYLFFISIYSETKGKSPAFQ